ncbi:hypothetical protein [Alteromonas ponticola]|uniref:Sulfotransferase domain-containing protein n=1 Tax=Alteromonas ponticola TaxID=2720613 RepID=A0ABX1R168_9ALTE|nr:hypothetical protein [Alteromonas ponticola]NMH60199.1 hypothetical protein [Alteromonas ponticola]
MRTIIHIGPHKTGSSAIQKWLLENRQHLIEEGVFYPPHEIDENGVSSGNFWNIAKLNSASELIVDNDKVEALYLKARNAKCHTVLLSSEFFTKYLSKIHPYFSDALYIGYIRFGLEVIESGYNQGVKRHGRAEKFSLPKRSFSRTLRLLEQGIKKVGVSQFIFRPYDQSLFEGKSIIADFLAAIDVTVSADNLIVESEWVNTSYSPEGLEFKRWFNHYPLNDLQIRLDSFLQHEGSLKKQKYSLLSQQEFARCKANMLKHLNSFCAKYPVKDADKLLALCSTYTQPRRVVQELPEEDFIKLLNEFIRYENNNAEQLYLWVKNQSKKVIEESHSKKFNTINKSIPLSIKIRYEASYYKSKLLALLR